MVKARKKHHSQNHQKRGLASISQNPPKTPPVRNSREIRVTFKEIEEPDAVRHGVEAVLLLYAENGVEGEGQGEHLPGQIEEDKEYPSGDGEGQTHRGDPRVIGVEEPSKKEDHDGDSRKAGGTHVEKRPFAQINLHPFEELPAENGIELRHRRPIFAPHVPQVEVVERVIEHLDGKVDAKDNDKGGFHRAKKRPPHRILSGKKIHPRCR